MTDEFNPEQRIVIAIMRYQGVDHPEDIVRADRVSAALIGSHFTSPVEELAAAAARFVKAFNAFTS